MTLFERIENLRKSKGISQGKLEKELGFSNGSISKWRTSTPTPERLQKIADYFGVTLDYLMTGTTGNDICSPCPDCGLWYDANNPEDIETHLSIHKKWQEAEKKYGKLYCNSTENEKIKAVNRSRSHDHSLSLNERCDAQLEVLRCLFSRSLEANDFSLSHVPFESYVSMMLGNKSYRGNNLDDDLFQVLADKYGIKSGINHGSVYYIPETKISSFTYKDERDIKRDLDSIMAKLSAGEDGPAAYDGENLDPEAAELFRDELEIALRRLKIINKEKYNPNKNKK